MRRRTGRASTGVTVAKGQGPRAKGQGPADGWNSSNEAKRSQRRFVAVAGRREDQHWSSPIRRDDRLREATMGGLGTGEVSVTDGDVAVLLRSRVQPDCFAELFERYFSGLHGYASRR